MFRQANNIFKNSFVILFIFMLLMNLLSPCIIAYNEDENIAIASSSQTTLQVVNRTSSTNLPNNSGRINKEITSFNANTGEVNVRLSFTNFASGSSSGNAALAPEIYFVLPENLAVDTTNYPDWVNLLSSFASKVLSKNSNTKLGVIGVKGPIADLIPVRQHR